MRRSLFSLFVILGACALGGCGRPYEIATPNGFIDFGERYASDGAHEYRAATADGVVIGARAFDNDPKADMALAVRALENRVRLAQGYALLAKHEVVARNGLKGTMLEFGHDEPSGPHLYLVTLFINDDHVFLLEAGGKKDLVEKARPSIDWAVKSFLPK
jgi:hypothetical protein